MRMTRVNLILAAATAACLAAPAAGEFTASLAPAPAQDAPWPFQPAKLRMHYAPPSDAADVRGVSLRNAAGGATMVFPAAMSAGGDYILPLALPAVSPQQTYEVRLIGADGEAAESVRTALAWPVAMLTTDAWIDPDAYEPFAGEAPAWPREVRRAALLTGVLFVLAMAATLLLGRASVASAGIVLAAGCVAATLTLRAAPPLEVDRIDLPAPSGGPQTLWAVGARRSSVWRLQGPPPLPVYRSREEMRRDRSVIDFGSGLTAPLRAGELRLFSRLPL